MAGVPSVCPPSEQTGEVVQQKIYTAEVVPQSRRTKSNRDDHYRSLYTY